jgi:hypothetical protein
MEVVRHDDEEIQVGTPAESSGVQQFLARDLPKRESLAVLSTTEPNRGTRATVVTVTKYTPSSR